jgi:hypothetical protein
MLLLVMSRVVGDDRADVAVLLMLLMNTVIHLLRMTEPFTS